MLDGAARVPDLVASGGGRRPAGARHHRPRQHVRGPRLLQGLPGRGHQPDHRHRGLHGGRVAPRAAGAPGQGRRHRRRRRRRPEALLPPDPARRDERGLPEPLEALLGRLPRGLLLQAPRRLGAARATTTRASSRRPAASAASCSRRCSPTTRPRPSAAPRGCRTSSGASTSSSSCRTTGSPSSTDQPAARRDRQAPRRAAARDQRQPLLAPRGRGGPRCAAVRADRRDDRRPEALQVRGRPSTT